MKKFIFGGALLALGAASALAGDVLEAKLLAEKSPRGLMQVGNFAGHYRVDRSTNRAVRTEGGLRGEVVYDSLGDGSLAESGFQFFDFEEFGDFVHVEQAGTLDDVSFVVWNGSETEGELLTQLDVNFRARDFNSNLLGEVQFPDLVLDPALGPGEFAIISSSGLAESGIPIPTSFFASIELSDVLGGTGIYGSVLFNFEDPASIGWSSEFFTIGSGFFYFPDDTTDPENPIPGLRANAGFTIGVVDGVAESARIWTTGAVNSVIFNAAQTFLGWLSGNNGAGLTERWFATPFRTAGDVTIYQVGLWYFENDPGETVGYRIYTRTNLDKPLEENVVAQGTLGAYTYVGPLIFANGGYTEFVLEEPIVLTGGTEYWFTMYGEGDPDENGLGNVAWFTNGNRQPDDLERDGGWRQRNLAEGYLDYAPANVAPTLTNNRPRNIWTPAFDLRGITEDSAPCSGITLADANGDDVLDFDDIDPFVVGLVGSAEWAEATGLPESEYLCRLDINGDGEVTFDDIDPFVECIVNGSCE